MKNWKHYKTKYKRGEIFLLFFLFKGQQMKNLSALVIDPSTNKIVTSFGQVDKSELIKRKKRSYIVGRTPSNNLIIAELCEIEDVS